VVVSIGKATSADYYTAGGGAAEGAASYYLDAVAAGEPAGQWAGSGAARLGLAGDVDPGDMHTLYGTFTHPVTGEPIGLRPAKRRSVEDRIAAALEAEPDALPERVQEIRRGIERSDRGNPIGWDATFSVAKSVTVAHTAAHRAELAAIRSGDPDRADRFHTIRTGIEDAISEANAAMLAYAETLATSRTGGGAGVPVQWTPAAGLTVASFFQHTNRNIDPQLHVHNVILNRAYCPDGKARSLDGQDLLAQRAALGAVAERVLEERLTALGFEFELRPDLAARELTVIPDDVAELFSSRSRQVSARVADLVAAAEERLGRELTDLELYRLKADVTLASRTAKHAHPVESRDEMLDRWAAETAAAVGRSLDGVADAIDSHLAASTSTAASGAADTPHQAEFSPAAVISEAVAACSEAWSAWTRPNLMLEISRRLPSLGGLSDKDAVAVLDRLTDLALASEDVVQVSGHAHLPGDTLDAGGPLASLVEDPFTRPTARLYAARDTLAAEDALRRAAITRGRHAADARDVADWLDQRCPAIGADQRAAVEGIAASDAALTVLVGPAGTGKSYAAGAFAGAWQHLTGGRVVGLAVSQVAAMVLRDDGIDAARNVTQWLITQDRLTAGSTVAEDRAWRVGPRDVVMVDEASMVATADLDRIRRIVEHAGARLVLTGDPQQLGAVEAGGVLDLLDGHAETYTLAEVRRFANDWERAASLALRDRDPDALAEYDRHARLVAHPDTAAAVEAAATAAVADRVDGRSVVVVTGTNDQAAAVSARVRRQLVDLGLVEEDGVLLGRDGCTGGVGDVIACRRNDYTIGETGVTNRVQYRVAAVHDDGSLSVEPLDASDHDSGGEQGAGDVATGPAPVRLPAGYVAEDVQLGYASTAHAAQGLTVDAAHLVTDGRLDAAGLYVGMTRGRVRNTAHVSTAPDAPDLPAGFDGANQRPSAVTVLEGCLERNDANRAATVEQERDHERLTSMANLAGRVEAVTRHATRDRMERHLDDLVAHGTLNPEDRARLGADQGAEHLARLLRVVEQAGHDPRQVLHEAVARRGFGDADSIAQVLSHRITGGRPLPPPVPDFGDGRTATIPADVSPEHVRHLEFLARHIQARRDVLGARTAAEAPHWAVEAFGPVPADGTARAEWERRAGIVAGHREATRWEHPHRAIGAMPGPASTERRASHVLTWETLGRPEDALDEAAMSDGRLRARVRAADAERAWAPPHVDDALAAAEAEAEQARQAAALLRVEADAADRGGDTHTAARLRADADQQQKTAALKAAAIEPLTQTAEGRAQWAATATVTLDHGARAGAELAARGLTPGTEPDRVPAAEFLAADRAARRADDAHRRVLEPDVIDPLADELTAAASSREPFDSAAPHVDLSNEPVSADGEQSSGASRAASRAWERLPRDVSPAELDLAIAATSIAVTKANDRASAATAHNDPDADEAHAAAAGAADDVAEADRRRRDDGDDHAAQLQRTLIDTRAPVEDTAESVSDA
jgi:conjugative relaxase-like TrwC/TraI family protein